MITVYLDSQDFSHFSVGHVKHEKYAELKNKLLELKREGKVRFVFSDIHFYEVFPKDGKAIAQGLERIRTVAEFCGKDSVPSIISLLSYEVNEEVAKIRGDKTPTISANWFPDLGLRSEPPIRPERLNREDRRALDKKFRRSKDGGAVVEELRQNFPFMKNTEIFLKYFQHQAEWEDVVQSIESSIQDIESFSKFLTSSSGADLDFPSILRSGYQSYVETVNAFKDKVELLASACQTSEQKSEITSEIDQALSSSLEELRISIVPELMSVLENDDSTAVKLCVSATMPSFDALIKYFVELIRRSAQISTPRKPIGSDFADALHVSYFPIVDVFRTDASAADALRRIYPHRKADIISDIFQLPHRILASV